MKRLYFVQPSVLYDGRSLYLPYASGCLAAYAMQFERIADEYELAGFIVKREPIEDSLKRFKDPDVVSFSCSSWNTEFNKALAKRIKEQYPDCVTVFGGHNIPEDNNVILDMPYADHIIFGEGERSFCSLLEAIADGSDTSDVPNVVSRKDGRTVPGKRVSYTDLDRYVSPYTSGVFDSLLDEYPEIVFYGVLETNRGCPYQCAYCDWSFSPKLRVFPIEKVFNDILWFKDHKIEYVFCADGNFGILDRDVEITKFIIETRKKYGYPKAFNTNYAKNSDDNVFEISKLLFDNGILKAISLAYQTVCEQALINTNRKNFTLEAFSDLVKRYNRAGIPTNTDLILGLPGETYESFCDGINTLMEAGQQGIFTVYSCQVYPNSPMGQKKYREKFGIKTRRMPLNVYHAAPMSDGITEYSEIITQTATMPYEDMLRSALFFACIIGLHHGGILKFISLYARHELGISFVSFYKKLLDYIFDRPDTFLNRLFNTIKAQCEAEDSREWTYFNPAVAPIGWSLDEGVLLETLHNFDRFWAEIPPFINELGIPAEINDQLCRYQRFVIRLPDHETCSAEFDFDFYGFFSALQSNSKIPLRKKRNRLELTTPNHVDGWMEYARFVVLYGKRRGDVILTSNSKNVTQSFIDSEEQNCG